MNQSAWTKSQIIAEEEEKEEVREVTAAEYLAKTMIEHRLYWNDYFHIHQVIQTNTDYVFTLVTPTERGLSKSYRKIYEKRVGEVPATFKFVQVWKDSRLVFEAPSTVDRILSAHADVFKTDQMKQVHHIAYATPNHIYYCSSDKKTTAQIAISELVTLDSQSIEVDVRHISIESNGGLFVVLKKKSQEISALEEEKKEEDEDNEDVDLDQVDFQLNLNLNQFYAVRAQLQKNDSEVKNMLGRDDEYVLDIQQEYKFEEQGITDICDIFKSLEDIKIIIQNINKSASAYTFNSKTFKLEENSSKLLENKSRFQDQSLTGLETSVVGFFDKDNKDLQISFTPEEVEKYEGISSILMNRSILYIINKTGQVFLYESKGEKIQQKKDEILDQTAYNDFLFRSEEIRIHQFQQLGKFLFIAVHNLIFIEDLNDKFILGNNRLFDINNQTYDRTKVLTYQGIRIGDRDEADYTPIPIIKLKVRQVDNDGSQFRLCAFTSEGWQTFDYRYNIQRWIRDNQCSRRYNFTNLNKLNEGEEEDNEGREGLLREEIHDVICLNNSFSKVIYVTKVKEDDSIKCFNGYEASIDSTEDLIVFKDFQEKGFMVDSTEFQAIRFHLKLLNSNVLIGVFNRSQQHYLVFRCEANEDVFKIIIKAEFNSVRAPLIFNNDAGQSHFLVFSKEKIEAYCLENYEQNKDECQIIVDETVDKYLTDCNNSKAAMNQIISFMVFDNQYVYINKKNSLEMLGIQVTELSEYKNNRVQYDPCSMRLAYISSNYKISIMPLFHTSRIPLMGFQMETPIVQSQFGTRYGMINNRGQYMEWSLKTGKIVSITEKWSSYVDFNSAELTELRDKYMLFSQYQDKVFFQHTEREDVYRVYKFQKPEHSSAEIVLPRLHRLKGVEKNIERLLLRSHCDEPVQDVLHRFSPDFRKFIRVTEERGRTKADIFQILDNEFYTPTTNELIKEMSDYGSVVVKKSAEELFKELLYENIQLEHLKFFDSHHLQILSVDDIEILLKINYEQKSDEQDKEQNVNCRIKSLSPLDSLCWNNGFDVNLFQSDLVPIEFQKVKAEPIFNLSSMNKLNRTSFKYYRDLFLFRKFNSKEAHEAENVIQSEEQVNVFPSMYQYQLDINPILGNIFFDEVLGELQTREENEESGSKIFQILHYSVKAQLTFRLFDWLVIEAIESAKKKVPRNIEINQRLTALFAIIPNPKNTTLLEAVCNKPVQINDLFSMWKKYHKDFMDNLDEDNEEEEYSGFLPIIPNLEEFNTEVDKEFTVNEDIIDVEGKAILPQKTQLGDSFEIRDDADDLDEEGGAAGEEEQEEGEVDEESVTFKTAIHKAFNQNNFLTVDRFLLELSYYPIASYARQIQDIVPEMIQSDLLNLQGFLDSRLLTVSWTEDFNKAQIDLDDDNPSRVYYMPSLWINFSRNEFDQLFFKNMSEEEVIKQREHGKKYQEEDLAIKESIQIKMQILDFPWLQYDDDFFVALKEADLAFFQGQAVQNLMEYKWSQIKKNLLLWLFLPYCILLSIFTFLTITNDILENNAVYAIVLKWIMVALAFYLICHEIIQARQGVYDYFTSIFNYFDMIAIVLLPVSVILQTLEAVDKVNAAPLYSITSFFLWLRFVYFLRIFTLTSYIITIVREVSKDMGPFMLAFIVVLAAFGSSWHLLSMAEDPEEEDAQFTADYADALMYAYKVSLGEFNDFAFGTQHIWLGWIYWIISSLFLLIILLNLLIAIISESFARVLEIQDAAIYKEIADLILDNQYLLAMTNKLFGSRAEKRKNRQDKLKFIVVVAKDGPSVKQEDSTSDDMKDLKETLSEMQQTLAKINAKLDSK